MKLLITGTPSPGGGPGRVTVERSKVMDGVEVQIERFTLPHILKHSPDGFAWGYSGSGPSDLALSLVAYMLGGDPAPAIYYHVRDQLIAELPKDGGWTLTGRQVLEAISEAIAHRMALD